MCSPAMQPCSHPPPPPSRNARAPVLLSSGRSAETGQPGQPTATLVKDYPPPSCKLTHAYSLARQSRARLRKRAASESGRSRGPHRLSCICMVSAKDWGLLSS